MVSHFGNGHIFTISQLFLDKYGWCFKNMSYICLVETLKRQPKMESKTKIEQAKKLYSLYADTKNTAEGDTAKKMLDNIMSKYGITLENILNFEVSERKFSYQKKHEFTLLQQIISKVYGGVKNAPQYYTYGKNKKTIYMEMSTLDYLEVEEMYTYYRKQLNNEIEKQIKATILGFYYKTDLFVEEDNNEFDDESESLSPEMLFLTVFIKSNMDVKTISKLKHRI